MPCPADVNKVIRAAKCSYCLFEESFLVQLTLTSSSRACRGSALSPAKVTNTSQVSAARAVTMTTNRRGVRPTSRKPPNGRQMDARQNLTRIQMPYTITAAMPDLNEKRERQRRRLARLGARSLWALWSVTRRRDPQKVISTRARETARVLTTGMRCGGLCSLT